MVALDGEVALAVVVLLRPLALLAELRCDEVDRALDVVAQRLDDGLKVEIVLGLGLVLDLGTSRNDRAQRISHGGSPSRRHAVDADDRTQTRRSDRNVQNDALVT